MRRIAETVTGPIAFFHAALRRYDRHVLLRHLEIWQTRLHWIAPASTALCLLCFAATARSVKFDDPVPSIDQLVYPLLLISAALLVIWIRVQASWVISHAQPTRLSLLRSTVIRLACIAGLLLPPIFLSLCLRHRTQTMISPYSMAFSSQAIAASAAACSRFQLGPPPPTPTACADSIARSKYPELEKRCVHKSRLTHFNDFRFDFDLMDMFNRAKRLDKIRLTTYERLPFTKGSAIARAAVATGAKRIEIRCKNPDASADFAEHAVALYLVQMERIHSYAFEGAFPRRSWRAVLYALAILGLGLPYVLAWAGQRRVFLSVGCLLGYIFSANYLGAMGWTSWVNNRFFTGYSTIDSGGELTLRVTSWGLVAVSVLPFIFLMAPLRRRAATQILPSATAAILVSTILPIVALWLHHPWDWFDYQAGDHSLIAVVISGFVYRPDEVIDQLEPFAYVAGLAYCSLIIVVMGPTMHRAWATPRP